MKTIEPPRFASDLYRDLRDRRLLIPVAALLVAIVAVPVILKSDSDAAPPLAAAAGVPEDAAAAAPAVLVNEAGVRDYRKRLDQLKETNPFQQKFALPTPESVELQGDDSSTGAPTAASGTGESSSLDTAVTGTTVTDTVDSAPSPVTTDTTVTEPDGEQVDTSVATEPEQPKPEARFYAGRIDVTVGELGDAKRVDGARYLDLLPSKSRPVVAFLGLAVGGEGAVFSVAREVVETDGDGSCAPKQPAPCQFLSMEVGDKRTFKYADGTTFRLTLRDTDIVRVPDPRRQQAADQPDAATD
jgi:hypothetical protein